MKFKKFLEGCEAINEAEYNKEWWDSKSDSFQKRYIERHPNSIYAQKANLSSKQKKDITNFVGKAFGKDSKPAKTAKDNLSDKSDDKTNISKPTSVIPAGVKLKKIDAFDFLSKHFNTSNPLGAPKLSMTPNDYEILRKTANDSWDKEEIDDTFAKSQYATPDFLHKYIKKGVAALSNRDNWVDPKKKDSIDSEISGFIRELGTAYNNPNLSDSDRKQIDELIKKSKLQKINKWPSGKEFDGDILSSEIQDSKKSMAPKTPNKNLLDIKDFIKHDEDEKPITTKIDTSKMNVKQKGDTFTKLLRNPGKYWVGQIVDPDNSPTDVITDNDGYVVGFTSKAAKKEYGKEPTEIDKANNKELEKWLSSSDYDEYFGN